MSVHANIVEHMTSNTLRMSTMFLRTLREDPADADVDSAKLLQRAGYIRKASPGGWQIIGRTPLKIGRAHV